MRIKDKTALAKDVVSLVVGYGVSKIVKSIIVNNTDPITIPEKAGVMVGSLVIGAMVVDVTSVYTDAKIDQIVNAYQRVKHIATQSS